MSPRLAVVNRLAGRVAPRAARDRGAIVVSYPTGLGERRYLARPASGELRRPEAKAGDVARGRRRSGAGDAAKAGDGVVREARVHDAIEVDLAALLAAPDVPA